MMISLYNFGKYENAHYTSVTVNVVIIYYEGGTESPGLLLARACLQAMHAV